MFCLVFLFFLAAKLGKSRHTGALRGALFVFLHLFQSYNSPNAMTLDSLTILNYKNLRNADITLSPNVNCFIGQNGEGKTNLLDAVYYLSFCRSAAYTLDSMNITHGERAFMLRGRYVADDGETEEIVASFQTGGKKVVRRDGKAATRLSEHIGRIPLVMTSPADESLVLGSGEERRRFLDQVISQTDRGYLEALVRYNKAVQQRNVLLRQDAEPDAALLNLWEEQMAAEGTIIYEARTRFVEAFVPIFQSYYDRIADGRERVQLLYTSHGQRGPLLDVIQRDRHKDRAVGYSLHGTHRDDLQMMLGDFELRREGSQGQRKSFVTALKLAQWDFLRASCHGRMPLLLLDDILDKLDAHRVEQIVSLVADEHFGQIFITDTNREHLDKILSALRRDYRLFHVSGGAIC